jgi:hypothetical protein
MSVDESDRRLVANVHPSEWVNPVPRETSQPFPVSGAR